MEEGRRGKRGGEGRGEEREEGEVGGGRKELGGTRAVMDEIRERGQREGRGEVGQMDEIWGARADGGSAALPVQPEGRWLKRG